MFNLKSSNCFSSITALWYVDVIVIEQMCIKENKTLPKGKEEITLKFCIIKTCNFFTLSKLKLPKSLLSHLKGRINHDAKLIRKTLDLAICNIFLTSVKQPEKTQITSVMKKQPIENQIRIL